MRPSYAKAYNNRGITKKALYDYMERSQTSAKLIEINRLMQKHTAAGLIQNLK
jgi:hypothetical protein